MKEIELIAILVTFLLLVNVILIISYFDMLSGILLGLIIFSSITAGASFQRFIN